MKRTISLVMVLGIAAIAACGDDRHNSSDAGAGIDAPTSSTSDAAIDAAIGTADATTVTDAAATPDAAAAGPVTVRVLSQQSGAPISGQLVAFLNADNSVVLETTTAVDGTATATMVAGGSVTVEVIPSNGAALKPVLSTLFDVSPGDELVVVGPQAAATSISVTVNVTPVDNATQYFLVSSCGNGKTSSATSSFNLQLFGSCATADLFFAAYDASNTLIDTMFAAAQPLADGATLDLTSNSFDAPIAATISVDNIPTAATSEAATVAVLDGAFLVQQDQLGANTLTLDGTSASGMWPIADDVTGDMLINATWQDSVSGEAQTLRTRVAQTAALSVDFGAVAIPVVATAGVFDLASSTVSWTESGAGSADASSVQLSVSQAAALFDIVPAPTTRLFTWRLVAPHTGTTMTLPVLPTSLASFNPTAAETVSVTIVAIANAPHGYDKVLASAFSAAIGAGPLTTIGDVAVTSQHRGAP